MLQCYVTMLAPLAKYLFAILTCLPILIATVFLYEQKIFVNKLNPNSAQDVWKIGNS